jgi:predicted ArsR family transcriptional regulator
MKLTKRQIIFIEKMLDIYLEVQEPIHYTTVAEQLNLSKYTAYDMLRLLEKKGYVESVYETRSEGPGRASISFQPTQKAKETVKKLTGDEIISLEEAKERIVSKIAAGEFEHAKLAEDILLQIDAGLDDVRYCSDLISDLVTRLRVLGRHRMMDYYASVILALIEKKNAGGLSLLPGFMLGLASAESNAIELTDNVLKRIRNYEILLDRMDKEARDNLMNLLSKVIAPLKIE